MMVGSRLRCIRLRHTRLATEEQGRCGTDDDFGGCDLVLGNRGCRVLLCRDGPVIAYGGLVAELIKQRER